ncbi:MAG: hypothetical protein R2731_10165 [Nocardioides sp.]
MNATSTVVRVASPEGSAYAVPTRARNRLGRIWRGHESDPSWARPVLLLLLLGTAAGYTVGLTANGWANAYYSAAVQAGRRAGRRSSSGPWTPPTRSRWTSRRPPCGSWGCRCASSV